MELKANFSSLTRSFKHGGSYIEYSLRNIFVCGGSESHCVGLRLKAHPAGHEFPVSPMISAFIELEFLTRTRPPMDPSILKLPYLGYPDVLPEVSEVLTR